MKLEDFEVAHLLMGIEEENVKNTNSKNKVEFERERNERREKRVSWMNEVRKRNGDVMVKGEGERYMQPRFSNWSTYSTEMK
jgi:hypothetical protein